jgi:hypothetical protein|tara:strand:- start:412 stop:531 length:120 start_codon:yes stop_codon:yes gene_type:complete
MEIVDTLPIAFVGVVFVVLFGYLLIESFWQRASRNDDVV